MKPIAALPRAGAHVHVRVSGCHIAIPVAQVREALPMPADGLTPLPRRTGALLGLVNAGGVPMPVVALERWLPIDRDVDGAAPAAAASRVLVLQHAGGIVGLRVDAVLGVHPTLAADVRRIHHVEDSDELFESVVPASADAPALCLLEVSRLMRLSQAWCSDIDAEHAPVGRPDETPDVASPTAPEPPRRHAVFRIGDELWAVPIGAVDRVAALPPIELALGSGQRSWAIGVWWGRKLPLVDLSAARVASSPESAPCMVQVSQGARSVGLTVTACLQFIDLPEAACAAVPAHEVLRGIAVLPALGKLHVLDVDKLFRLTPETSISQDADASPNEGGVSRADTEILPYLVFEAGQRYASPVEGIVGVVELPAATRDDLRNDEPAALSWRGRTLRVVSMPSLTGRIGDRARVDAMLAVLVQPSDSAVPPLGIAIERLSDWLPAHSARRRAMRIGNLGALHLIEASGAAENASLIVVDLAQMAYLLD